MIEARQEQEREQLVSFLKESSILRVIDSAIISGVSRNLEEIKCGPGHIVFREGDNSDGLYIVKSGSVEVTKQSAGTRPLAYLTAGECFGEMSLLEGGARNATIRVPEEAVLLRLTKKASEDLKSKFPALAEEFASLANKRNSGVPFKAPGLQGNTAFFDMPTVIQAVASSRQSGSLNVMGLNNKPKSRLVFFQGKLVAAYYEHLVGEMAVFSLLGDADPSDFAFARAEDIDLAREHQNLEGVRPLDMLLIEGTRRLDELPKLSDTIGGVKMTFALSSIKPDYTSLPSFVEPLARKISTLVEMGLSAEGMVPHMETDIYAIVQTLSELLAKKIIKKDRKEGSPTQETLVHRIDVTSIDTDEDTQAVTAPLDLRQLFKGSAKVASTLYALNMVASNLAAIIDPTVVKSCLEQALQESSKRYPQLSSLKVHPGGRTLDVRGASPELSSGVSSTAALDFLTKRFLG